MAGRTPVNPTYPLSQIDHPVPSSPMSPLLKQHKLFSHEPKREKLNLDGVAKVFDGRTGREYESGEYKERRSKREQSRVQGRFIKGPIPIPWVARAIRLRKPSAIKVAVALFYQRGLCSSNEFKIEPARFLELNVDELTRRRGLVELERSGLITVQRWAGRSPVVAMIGVDNNPAAESGPGRAGIEK